MTRRHLFVKLAAAIAVVVTSRRQGGIRGYAQGGWVSEPTLLVPSGHPFTFTFTLYGNTFRVTLPDRAPIHGLGTNGVMSEHGPERIWPVGRSGA